MLLEEEQPTQLELFEDNLPYKPYCSEQKGFLKIRSKAIAKLQNYIQHNKPTEIRWLVFDCDYWGALEHVGQNHLPPPNIIATNRANGHSHLFYGLEVPVIITENGRAKPKAFLTNIAYALGVALESDQGYSNFISKNPLQKDFWDVAEVKKQPWELADFLEFLEVPTRTPPKAKIIGVGRNVTLFENARRWAYRQVLAYRLKGSKDAFCGAVLEFCEQFNEETFPTPLDFSEVKATAKSISKWTWSKFTGRMSDQDWSAHVARTHTSEIQARRGKAGGLKGGRGRASTDQEKRLSARSMRSEGMTQATIATALGVNQATISRWLK
jgi:hypothetical protein